MNEVLF